MPDALDYAIPQPRRKRRWWFPLMAVGFVLAIALPIPLVWVLSNHWSHMSAREEPSWIRCTSNLHTIGFGIILYQNDNNGKYPADFRELYLFHQGKFPSSVFICPNSTDTAATGNSTQAIADQLLAGGHCSYVYLGKGMSDKTDPNAVVAYDPPGAHDGMMVVLFADGHADVLRDGDAAALMAKLKSPATTMPVPVTWP